MRISLFILLAFALFAQAAYAASNPPPVLTKITGYGEYKLGASISQYDLSEFDGPTWSSARSTEKWSCYIYLTESTLKIGLTSISIRIVLQTANDKLEGISLQSGVTTSPQFSDSDELNSFAMELRRVLLDKYSRELVELDDFGAGTYSSKIGNCRRLKLIDKDGNSLTLSTMGQAVLEVVYNSSLNERITDAMFQRMGQKLLQNDEGKL